VTGELAAIEYPDKRRARLRYDSTGNLQQLTDLESFNEFFSQFDYYADGNVKQIQGYMKDSLGMSSFSRVYLFDTNHLLEKTTSRFGGHAWSTTWDYWEDGNVKSYETQGSVGSITDYGYEYEFDRLNRVAKAVFINANIPVNTHEFAYNDNGTLDSVAEGGKLWQYEYLNKQHHTLQKISLKGTNEYYQFAYDKMGQRQMDIHQKTGTNERLYGWTADGSIHTSTEKTNGLAQSEETFYSLSGLGERSTGKDDNTIYHDIIPVGDLVCILSSNGEKTLQFNDKNSSSYVFNWDTTLLSAHAYSPYGQEISLGGFKGSYSKYGYSGKEKDGRTLYYGARHYDPTSRQFLSIDPLSRQGLSIENYLLSGGSPINRVDPDGRDHYDVYAYEHHYIDKSGPAFGGDYYGAWSGIPGGAYVGPHDWLGSTNMHWLSGNRYVDAGLGVIYKSTNALVNTASFIVNIIPNSTNKIAVAVRNYQDEIVVLNLATSLYQAYVTGGGDLARVQSVANKVIGGIRNRTATLWNATARTTRGTGQGRSFGTRYNTGRGPVKSAVSRSRAISDEVDAAFGSGRVNSGRMTRADARSVGGSGPKLGQGDIWYHDNLRVRGVGPGGRPVDIRTHSANPNAPARSFSRWNYTTQYTSRGFYLLPDGTWKRLRDMTMAERAAAHYPAGN
jgi:RHS repeat-associated protein